MGYMLTHIGIEANPDKCKAAIDMRSPQNVKEIQRLAIRLASLSRFLPKSAEKTRPFFQLLKKPKEFKWTEDCEKAFGELKQFLTSPPILTRPQLGKDMYPYLFVNDHVISAVIIQEEEKQLMLVCRIL